MKIGFLIIDEQGKTRIVYTQKELIRHGKGVEKEIYSLIKALEVNDKFIQNIKNIRKKLQIPSNGYTWQEYYEMLVNHKHMVTGNETFSKKDLIFINWQRRVDKASKYIIKKFYIHPILSRSIYHIIIGSFLYIPNPIVYVSSDIFDSNNVLFPEEINITIQSKVTKNYLIQFINKNWNTISKAMDKIADKPKFFISDRDKYIVYLRDKKKLKFKEIADVLSLKTKNYGLYEDNIKTAYHRAKNKINVLSNKKVLRSS